MSNPQNPGGGYHDPQNNQGGYNGPQSNGQYQNPGQSYDQQYGQPQYGAQSAQAGHGQSAYGQPGGYYAQGGTPKRGGRGGKIAFFIGLGMMLLGLILTIIGFTTVAGTVMEGVDTNSGGLPNQFTGTTTIPGGDGQGAMIMAMNGTDPSCTVTSPSGADVPLNESASSSQTQDGVSVETVGLFQAEESGSYTVDCTGAEAFGYVPVDAGEIMTGGALILGGMLIGGLGFLVGLIGLIIWLSNRNKITYS